MPGILILNNSSGNDLDEIVLRQQSGEGLQASHPRQINEGAQYHQAVRGTDQKGVQDGRRPLDLQPQRTTRQPPGQEAQESEEGSCQIDPAGEDSEGRQGQCREIARVQAGQAQQEEVQGHRRLLCKGAAILDQNRQQVDP